MIVWFAPWFFSEFCINIESQGFLRLSFLYIFEKIRCIINPLLSSCYNLTALLGGAGAGLGSSLGAVPGGQPSAPNLNPPSQIDPSSIERAYAALGLTYQGNQIQAQTAQPSMPNQGMQGQAGMRPLNPMGELVCVLTCLPLQVFSVERHTVHRSW